MTALLHIYGSCAKHSAFCSTLARAMICFYIAWNSLAFYFPDSRVSFEWCSNEGDSAKKLSRITKASVHFMRTDTVDTVSCVYFSWGPLTCEKKKTFATQRDTSGIRFVFATFCVLFRLISVWVRITFLGLFQTLPLRLRINLFAARWQRVLENQTEEAGKPYEHSISCVNCLNKQEYLHHFLA